MSVLADYLARVSAAIDFSAYFDLDPAKTKTAPYERPLAYKYFAPARRRFFEQPQLRFSQHEVLNDPFEMSNRWKELGFRRITDVLMDELRENFAAFANDRDLQLKVALEMEETGDAELDAARATELRARAAKGETLLPPPVREALLRSYANGFLLEMEQKFQVFIDRAVARHGILSLTEDPLNQAMWAHYGAEGAGFVVGFDPEEKPLANGADGKPKTLLRQVDYADDIAESYAKNPHYLFLVKKREWSYEREWRVLRDLDACDEILTPGQQRVALCNVAPTVKEVNFGYAYDPAHLREDSAAVARSCPGAQLFRLEVNRHKGTLERVAL
jgi:hypothetical protein